MSVTIAESEFNKVNYRVEINRHAMAEYLKTGDTFGDEYQDLRRARNDLADKLDYLTVALNRVRASVMERHLTLEQGDRVTLSNGLTGTIHARGSLAGWVILDGRDNPTRFEATEVVSVERATPSKLADPRYVAGVSDVDDDMSDAEWLSAYGRAS